MSNSEIVEHALRAAVENIRIARGCMENVTSNPENEADAVMHVPLTHSISDLHDVEQVIKNIQDRLY